MKVRPFLRGVQSPLFHATTGPRAANIALRGQGIKADSGFSNYGGNVYGISMSRDLGFLLNGGFGGYIFVFEHRELAAKFRINPFQAGLVGDEFEERVEAKHIPASMVRGVIFAGRTPRRYELKEWSEEVTYPIIYKDKASKWQSYHPVSPAMGKPHVEGVHVASKPFQKNCPARKPVKTPDSLAATGSCYEDAATYLLYRAPNNAVMVHGRPTLTRPPFIEFGHGWIEVGDKVIDPSAGFTGPKAIYYALGNIDYLNNLLYTKDEAADFLVLTGHYGPWEGVDGTPANSAQKVAWKAGGKRLPKRSKMPSNPGFGVMPEMFRDNPRMASASRVAAWSIWGTKSQSEKDDEATDDLVKPSPKKKPPRKDLRKKWNPDDDKDLKGQGADGDRDLSLNYKRVAHRWAMQQAPVRVAARWAAKAEPLKPGKTRKNDKGQWVGRPMDPDSPAHAFEYKEQAEAYAKGMEPQSSEDIKQKKIDEGRADKAKYDEKDRTKRVKDKADEKAEKKDTADSNMKTLSKKREKIKQDKKDKRQNDTWNAIDDGALKEMHKETPEMGTKHLTQDQKADIVEDYTREVQELRDGTAGAAELVATLEDAKEAQKKALPDAFTHPNAYAAALAQRQYIKENLPRLEADREKQTKEWEASAGVLKELGKYYDEDRNPLSHKEKEAIVEGYTTQLAALRAGPQEGVELSDEDKAKAVRLQKVIDDPERAEKFLEGDLPDAKENPGEFAGALAERQYIQDKLFNPMTIGGVPLSPHGGLDGDQIRERAKASMEQYAKQSPDARQDAAKALVEKLESLPDDDPQREELDHLLDGIAIAAIATGDEDAVPGRPHPTGQFRMLVKAAIQQGRVADMFGEPGQNFSSTSHRGLFESVMTDMTEDAFVQAMGGIPDDDGWRPEPNGLEVFAKDPLTGEPKYNVRQRNRMRQFLMERELDGISIGHAMATELSEGSGKKPKEVVEIQARVAKEAQAKLSRSPIYQKIISEDDETAAAAANKARLLIMGEVREGLEREFKKELPQQSSARALFDTAMEDDDAGIVEAEVDPPLAKPS